MEFKNWVEAERGRACALAGFLIVSPPFVSKMVSGEKAIPIRLMARIESFTGKQVTRQEMCPTEWQQIWPELVPKPVMEEGDLHASECAVPTAEKSELLPTYPEVTNLEPIQTACNESTPA